jgi:hypothetical protein
MQTLIKVIPNLKALKCRYRCKIRHESLTLDWSNWLIQPTESYVEVERQGPYALHQIEWIDIDPIEKRQVGKLVATALIDHTEVVLKLLQDSAIHCITIDKLVRIIL